jgi:hypothetical protein
MQTTEVATEQRDDLIDEFDLDIRVSVLPTSDVSNGFSTWMSCKTCTTSCHDPLKCLTTTTQGC